MEIGETIRKRRKELGMTQEEVARRLGVTAPAVNRWENGNAMPDITLLSPLARLLSCSLDELLSFEENLSGEQVAALTAEAVKKLEEEGYEAAFSWAKKKIETYPNCEPLTLSLSLQLDAGSVLQELPEEESRNSFLVHCYERLLKSGEESIRQAAAGALYGFYLRREQYGQAETYLSFFPGHDLERKRKEAQLFELSGRQEEAYKAYEEILYSGYQILDAVLHGLFLMKRKEGDLSGARYYAEKRRDAARLFEAGDYAAHAAQLELLQAEQDRGGTIACIQELLKSVETLDAYRQAPLYAHMTFREIGADFYESVRRTLRDCVCGGGGFGYMQGDHRWEALARSLRGDP